MKKKTILIISIIAILGALILFGKFKNYTQDKRTLEEGIKQEKIVIRVDDLRNYTINSLKKGDSIYLENAEYRLGKIEKVNSEKYIKEIVDIEGEIIYAEVPEKHSLFLTVNAEVKNEGGKYFSRENRQLNVNSDMKFTTYKTVLQGKIIDVGIK